MWDLKLVFLDIFFYFNLFTEWVLLNLTNFYDPFFFNGLLFANFKTSYQFVFNSAFFFGLKFLITIGFLVLIRGGTPRYRYDYLTKLGWLRFIGLIILLFFFSLIIFYIF